MNGPRIFFIIVGFGVLLGGCEPTPAHRVQVHQDLGSTPVDVGEQDAFLDNIQDAQTDSASDAMQSEIDDVECVLDADCGELGVCDQSGRCAPAARTLFFRPTADGLSRVGAASFSIVPDDFESWTDRASPACPENRVGVFDGFTDEPSAGDECQIHSMT